MLKIRRPLGRLIFNMGIAIPGKTVFLIETAPCLQKLTKISSHCSDVIMGMMASQITSLTIVYSNVYSGADQRKHQSSVSLAFVRGIYRWPVNSLHKGPVTRKCFHLMTSSWDDVRVWKIFSSLQTLCERNPSVPCGFPSQKASHVELWCSLWC